VLHLALDGIVEVITAFTHVVKGSRQDLFANDSKQLWTELLNGPGQIVRGVAQEFGDGGGFASGLDEQIGHGS